MSDETPDGPGNPPPPPQEQGPPSEPRRDSLRFGILLGVPALFALYFGTTSGIDEGYNAFFPGPAAFTSIAVYLVVAMVLAGRPRTSRLGAGLLMGLGIFTLLGGGLCVGILAQRGG
ncbi:hypothetical protein [Pseudarthrobacter sp. AB1]|uniref:hypothetical protein n=1 Tax=Pseudarthrobacter sp. AB1 TaxID=2138309 RepID=UPI00186BA3BF|nr:hypothetical protein [Pseudarthrobacter sp. AB1]